ncbi:hypothetical protein RIF29_34301 [Crotalaria pallida]|uniref:Uncharacterized protein n=1 Tax=Crotalaria pallida TaxID=3830 RepID=A0AAN9E8T0_CROPI
MFFRFVFQIISIFLSLGVGVIAGAVVVGGVAGAWVFLWLLEVRSCSKPSNHIEELVHSSNVRMCALFGNDDNLSVRRFAHDFDFNDDSGDRQKSHYTQLSVVKCDSGKNSKRGLVIASVSHYFDLNSNPVDYSSNDGNFDAGFHFEICEMDNAIVRSTFEPLKIQRICKHVAHNQVSSKKHGKADTNIR